jgi:hypothetical protein
VTGSFSPNGKWFTRVIEAGELVLWKMSTGKETRRIAFSKGDNRPSLAFSPDERALAVGTGDSSIQLFELATGNLRHRIAGGHHAAICSLIFAADSRRLVSGSEDTTALVWDLTGRLTGKSETLSPAKLDACWADLRSDDAAQAYRAIRCLTAAPAQAVSLFNKRLQPAAAPDQKRQTSLIAGLASDSFATRQAATAELAKLGDMAETALLKAFDKAPTVEARLRISQLLTKLEQIGASGEPLRQARAVETLERIGTPAARQLLARLAAGASEAHLTNNAKGALHRLGPAIR